MASLPALLLPLLSNKIFLAGLGCLVAAIGLFLRGYQAGSKAQKQSEQDVEISMNKEIQQTEAKNQTIDAQRETNAQTATASDDVTKLIGVWNKLNQKTDSDQTKTD